MIDTITNITDLVWLNSEKTRVNCNIVLQSGKILPYTASQSDSDPQGRKIFDLILKDYYDVIGDHAAPTEEELLAISSNMARLERNSLLSKLDIIISNPLRWNSFTSDQQTEIATYRQALLDVPQQATFPATIEWPTKPAFI